MELLGQAPTDAKIFNIAKGWNAQTI